MEDSPTRSIDFYHLQVSFRDYIQEENYSRMTFGVAFKELSHPSNPPDDLPPIFYYPRSELTGVAPG
jgi:hypothetical protein